MRLNNRIKPTLVFQSDLYEICGLFQQKKNQKAKGAGESNISWRKLYVILKKILPQLGVINKNETFV